MRRRWIALPVAMAIAVFGAASHAFAAPPDPFGHSCQAQSEVLFCPTTSRADRVKTFDGVPLDVDVTLPGRGTDRSPRS